MTTRIQLFLGLRDVTAKGVEEPYLHETSIRSIVALELCNFGHELASAWISVAECKRHSDHITPQLPAGFVDDFCHRLAIAGLARDLTKSTQLVVWFTAHLASRCVVSGLWAAVPEQRQTSMPIALKLKLPNLHSLPLRRSNRFRRGPAWRGTLT